MVRNFSPTDQIVTVAPGRAPLPIGFKVQKFGLYQSSPYGGMALQPGRTMIPVGNRFIDSGYFVGAREGEGREPPVGKFPQAPQLAAQRNPDMPGNQPEGLFPQNKGLPWSLYYLAAARTAPSAWATGGDRYYTDSLPLFPRAPAYRDFPVAPDIRGGKAFSGVQEAKESAVRGTATLLFMVGLAYVVYWGVTQ